MPTLGIGGKEVDVPDDLWNKKTPEAQRAWVNKFADTYGLRQQQAQPQAQHQSRSFPAEAAITAAKGLASGADFVASMLPTAEIVPYRHSFRAGLEKKFPTPTDRSEPEQMGHEILEGGTNPFSWGGGVVRSIIGIGASVFGAHAGRALTDSPLGELAGGMLGGAISGVGQTRKVTGEIAPTLPEMQAMKNAAYDEVGKIKADFPIGATNQLANQLTDKLAQNFVNKDVDGFERLFNAIGTLRGFEKGMKKERFSREEESAVGGRTRSDTNTDLNIKGKSDFSIDEDTGEYEISKQTRTKEEKDYKREAARSAAGIRTVKREQLGTKKSLSANELIGMTRTLRNIASRGGIDADMANMMRQNILDFLRQHPAVQKKVDTANAMNAAYERAKRLDTDVTSAEVRTAASGDIDRMLRKKVEILLLDNKFKKTPQERALMAAIVNSDRSRASAINIARQAAKMGTTSGNTNHIARWGKFAMHFLAHKMGIGAAVHALNMIVGAIAEHVATGSVKSNVDVLEHMIRSAPPFGTKPGSYMKSATGAGMVAGAGKAAFRQYGGTSE